MSDTTAAIQEWVWAGRGKPVTAATMQAYLPDAAAKASHVNAVDWEFSYVRREVASAISRLGRKPSRHCVMQFDETLQRAFSGQCGMAVLFDERYCDDSTPELRAIFAAYVGWIDAACPGIPPAPGWAS